MNHRFAICEDASSGDADPSARSGSSDAKRADEESLAPDPPPQRVREGIPKLRRGFAAMDRKAVSEIARKGGRAAHSSGRAHQFTSEEARVAGRKGGLTTHARRREATSSRDHGGNEGK